MHMAAFGSDCSYRRAEVVEFLIMNRAEVDERADDCL